MLSIMNKIRFISIITMLVMLFSFAAVSPTLAEGAPGSLDPTFGMDGRVILDLEGSQEYAAAIAVDELGRILTTGPTGEYPEYDFVVARLNPDGTPDTSFGMDGYTIVDLGALDVPSAIALDKSGHILAAGFSSRSTENYEFFNNFVVVRLNSNGSLDTTFGSGGQVIVEFDGRTWSIGYAMQLDDAGRILLAGASEDSNYEVDFAVTRLNSDGTLDTSFGEGGLATADFGGGDYAHTMVLDETGRIIAAGETATYTEEEYFSDVAVARFNPDGTLDPGFDGDGRAIIDFGGTELAVGVAVDEEGRIVFTNLANIEIPDQDTIADIGVIRLNPDGSFDASFGTNGQLKLDLGAYDYPAALTLDEAGHIIIAGSTDIQGNDDFAVLQLNPDGTFDVNFDEDGLALIDFGGYDWSAALTLDQAGRILIAGSTDIGSTDVEVHYDFALTRLIGSPTSTLTINGFYQPVEMDSKWNTVKGGVTIPLKFEVFDGETELTDPVVINQPLTATQSPCDGGPTDDVELVATGETSLRYDEAIGQFIYNWKTPKKPGYCYVVTVTLEDGTSLSANFKLK